ncbi:hypothetical protein LT85_2915 [Collimonas arenae]|uniref:Treble clef zinc finger domain-containing protein n=1 Tax=Collimonas arenae TaxID=279058 RepID=A0A0A1FBE6_9BURK|nr:zinc-ribbon domain-containing protein [Collimonas arenae]AIY42073.1 hypothetical protein LT85_2915 [Collimonas arenae]
MTSPKKTATRLVTGIAKLRDRYPLAGQAAATRRKNGLLLLRGISKLHSGECLATSVDKTVGQLYRLRCAHGHEWDAELRQLYKGAWCSACVFQSYRLTIEDMQERAGKRGGLCLSTQYVNAHTRLQWQCEVGHQWLATPHNIRGGRWCPKCRGYLPAEEQIALLARIAQERGGKLLSTVYGGSDELLQWRCAEGHTWMSTPGSVKNGKSWCPKCRGRYPKKEMLAQYRQIARERGGELLSTHFVSTQDNLTWRCCDGHTWEAQPNNIKLGTWCPKCHGFCTDEEHYAILCELALARGGRLLSERYLGPDHKLTWACHRGHTWNATRTSVKLNGRWCPRCRILDTNGPKQMQKYLAVARERGGQCLSTEYMTSHKQMQWQCAEGHIFSATPSNVMGGKWCPRCIGRMSAEEHYAQLTQLARERGGKLLSERFVSLDKKMTWLCHRGHAWRAIPSSVKRGTWCKQCAILEKCGPRSAWKYLSPSDQRDDLVFSSGEADNKKI